MTLINCSACGETISPQAIACPKCGHPTPKPTRAGTWLVLIVLGVVAIAIYNAPSTRPPGYSSEAGDGAVVRPEATVNTPMPTPEWYYSASKAKMVTNGIDRSAMMVSNNMVDFGFPYAGPQPGSLIIRLSAETASYDVLFSINKGQLVCSNFEHCTVPVKFDDEPSKSYPTSESTDHDSTVLFIGDESDFVSRLERAKVVKIQPTAYQNGSPVFEFKAAGFSTAKLKAAAVSPD